MNQKLGMCWDVLHEHIFDRSKKHCRVMHVHKQLAWTLGVLWLSGKQIHGRTTIAGGISSLDVWCRAVWQKLWFVFIGMFLRKQENIFADKLYKHCLCNAWFSTIKSSFLIGTLFHSMLLSCVCCRYLFMEVLWALNCQGWYGLSGKSKTGHVAIGILSGQVQKKFNHPAYGNCWQGPLRMPAFFERLNCDIFKNTFVGSNKW